MRQSGFWNDGKRWVYSITYDEGLRPLLEYALPAHREFGIPGHLCPVASQIGVPRDVPGSSYSGIMVLSEEDVRHLVEEGCGVSSHSMTHSAITEGNAEYEVQGSKALLEERLEMPIETFSVPGSNDSYPPSIPAARKAGYKAIMTIYDEVNTRETDLMRLCRVPLHAQYPPPFYSAFDPYKRIHQAIELGGWIIDYCHCPIPHKPIHPWKDCTLEELIQRFETVTRIGGDDVWLAEPGEVVRYITERRNA